MKIVKAQCDCGTIKNTYLNGIKNGSSKSCGCYLREIQVKKGEHKKSNNPMYNMWRGMKERCNNPNFKQYKDYGGRGISVYPYWQNDFSHFIYWCVKHGYKKGLELDRIDNDKNYEPSNCRFNTHKGNNRNKRNNRYIVFKGEKRALSEWCEIYNASYSLVATRLNRGWQINDALVTPPKKVNN